MKKEITKKFLIEFDKQIKISGLSQNNPFRSVRGEAQLSKTYLARLRRIDEMAYGVAPGQAVAAGAIVQQGCGFLVIARNPSRLLSPSSAHPKTRSVVSIFPPTPTRANLCWLS